MFECDQPLQFADSPVSTRSSLTIRRAAGNLRNPALNRIAGEDGGAITGTDYTTNSPHSKRARLDRIGGSGRIGKSPVKRNSVESPGAKYLQTVLPDELIGKIFGNLDARSVCRVSQVSKGFFEHFFRVLF